MKFHIKSYLLTYFVYRAGVDFFMEMMATFDDVCGKLTKDEYDLVLLDELPKGGVLLHRQIALRSLY